MQNRSTLGSCLSQHQYACNIDDEQLALKHLPAPLVAECSAVQPASLLQETPACLHQHNFNCTSICHHKGTTAAASVHAAATSAPHQCCCACACGAGCCTVRQHTPPSAMVEVSAPHAEQLLSKPLLPLPATHPTAPPRPTIITQLANANNAAQWDSSKHTTVHVVTQCFGRNYTTQRCILETQHQAQAIILKARAQHYATA